MLKVDPFELVFNEDGRIEILDGRRFIYSLTGY